MVLGDDSPEHDHNDHQDSPEWSSQSWANSLWLGYDDTAWRWGLLVANGMPYLIFICIIDFFGGFKYKNFEKIGSWAQFKNIPTMMSLVLARVRLPGMKENASCLGGYPALLGRISGEKIPVKPIQFFRFGCQFSVGWDLVCWWSTHTIMYNHPKKSEDFHPQKTRNLHLEGLDFLWSSRYDGVILEWTST